MDNLSIAKAAMTLNDLGAIIAASGGVGATLGAGSGLIKDEESDGVLRNTGRGALTGVGGGVGAGLGVGAVDLGLGLLGADPGNPTVSANVLRAVAGLFGGLHGARLGRRAGQSMVPEYAQQPRRSSRRRG